MDEGRLQRKITQLEEELEIQNQIIQSMSSPPLIRGTISDIFDDNTIEVTIKDARYVVTYDPRLAEELKKGKDVSLNRNTYSIVSVTDAKKEGKITIVSEVLDDGRIKAEVDGSFALMPPYEGVKRGDSIIIDKTGAMIIDNLGKQNKSFALETVEKLPWDRIGGLEDTIGTIKDVIETPFLHKDLYEKYNKRVPKGVLFFGPPGCGKTLLAKSMAYNLAKAREKMTGSRANGHFMSIKGPEILNKYVGVAEDSIRQIFASAREKSSETGEPVVIFIDEAESILKMRGTGISTDVYDSIVPQFLVEMNGLDSNYNVIVTLATNRPDILDPALLRPGRIDEKLEIKRPGKEGGKEIYRIYLEGLPFSKSIEREAEESDQSAMNYLALAACEKLFSDENMIGMINFFDNTSKPVRYRNLISGALIESSVQRAVGYAIKREITNGSRDIDHGVCMSDLLQAVDAEYKTLGTKISNLLTETDIHLIAGDRYDQIRNIKSIMR